MTSSMRIYGLEEHMATADVVGAWKRQDPQLTEPMMRWAVASDTPWANSVCTIRRGEQRGVVACKLLTAQSNLSRRYY